MKNGELRGMIQPGNCPQNRGHWRKPGKDQRERGHGQWQQGVIFFLALVRMAQRLLFLMVRHIFR